MTEEWLFAPLLLIVLGFPFVAMFIMKWNSQRILDMDGKEGVGKIHMDEF